MADKRQGGAKCPIHGEYWLDAPDSPCPSCEDCECVELEYSSIPHPDCPIHGDLGKEPINESR